MWVQADFPDSPGIHCQCPDILFPEVIREAHLEFGHGWGQYRWIAGSWFESHGLTPRPRKNLLLCYSPLRFGADNFRRQISICYRWFGYRPLMGLDATRPRSVNGNTAYASRIWIIRSRGHRVYSFSPFRLILTALLLCSARLPETITIRLSGGTYVTALGGLF